MDLYDRGEEEAQRILGYGAKNDIQNEPADHEEREEEAQVEELVGQDILRVTSECTGSVALPPVPSFTLYEHYQ